MVVMLCDLSVRHCGSYSTFMVEVSFYLSKQKELSERKMEYFKNIMYVLSLVNLQEHTLTHTQRRQKLP